jgi:predicted DNA-binding protein (UPF0251 family)
LFPSGLLHGTRFIDKPNPRGKSHLDPLGFALAYGDIDIVRVAQFLLCAALLALKEPGFGMFDASHLLHNIQADGSPNKLNQGLVVETGFRVNGKLVAQHLQQLNHILRAQIELEEMLIDRKAQRRCSRSSAAHGILPFLLALVRNLAIAEKLSKGRVCVRTGPAGIVRRSHIVAFLWKVRVVRDALVFQHRHIPLRIAYGAPQDRKPMLEGYDKNKAMSRYLKPGEGDNFDASAWISQAGAARLRGVTRAAIASLVKRNRFKMLKIGDKTLLSRADIENFQPQPRGPKPKKKHKEVESTPPHERSSPTVKQSETRISGKKNQGINRLNTSTIKYQQSVKPGDWISQAEAARVRGVSQQAIVNLIRRGRLTTVNMAGRTVVLRSEVENFVAQLKGGRPSKLVASKKSANDRPSKK